MGPLALLLMSLGLAADSFAASVVRGGGVGRPGLRLALLVAAVFSLCQVVMPLLGWLAGRAAWPLVAGIDHWIAFAILAGLGVKMVLGGRRGPAAAPRGGAVTLGALALTGLATSVDSLFAGMSLGGGSAAQALAVIGAVTFIVCLAGVQLGRQLGRRLGYHAETAGGLALTAVGAIILANHLGLT